MSCSRIVVGPDGIECGRAGANVAAFPTIHKKLPRQAAAPTLDDCSWIVGAEHGVGNIVWYHLSSKELADRFMSSGFHLEARIMFGPDGSEIKRAGWNFCAKTTIANAMKRHIHASSITEY
mmetsp:Transcript_2091/g.3651  ORF Transcript_2091/g.3651 Transcript_2091/m.3651 type:complete len:121 (+) Transcript_2091:370-732(+)